MRANESKIGSVSRSVALAVGTAAVFAALAIFPADAASRRTGHAPAKATTASHTVAPKPQLAPAPVADLAPPVPARPLAKPIGSPASWFPADAYPPAARTAGQQGRTEFSVDIDAQGRIMQCNIVKSSGSEVLDNRTCDLVVANGRFTPAHDANGNAVAGIWHSGMRWELVAGGTIDADETN